MRAEMLDLPPGWPHHIEKVLELLEMYQPKNCVELGTCLGASAIALTRLLRRWNGRLTCVDTWNEPKHGTSPAIFLQCVEHMRTAGVIDSISLAPSRTVDVAAHWTQPIDFLYVDADHEYESVRDDLNAWWPHLCDGGLICGDDYEMPGSGVKQAWDEFGQQIGQEFEHFATPNTDPPGMKLVWGFKR